MDSNGSNGEVQAVQAASFPLFHFQPPWTSQYAIGPLDFGVVSTVLTWRSAEGLFPIPTRRFRQQHPHQLIASSDSFHYDSEVAPLAPEATLNHIPSVRVKHRL